MDSTFLRACRRCLRPALIAVFTLGTVITGRAQGAYENGIMLADAPVFITPDPTRVPLATLPAGTAVKVTTKEGAWYQVVFHDERWGDRTGYTLAVNVRIAASTPLTADAPGAAPARRAPQPPATPRPPAAAVASAARNGPPPYRGIVSVNGLRQETSTAFTGTTSFVQNAETGHVTTSYGADHPLVVDVAATGQVWHALGITLAATWSAEKSDGAISASIPHPFVFNAPRTVSGTATGLKRREIAVHLDPSVLLSMGSAVQLVLFGGPSYFRMKQGLVTGVTSTDVYPYDTATFVAATTAESTRSRLGYNAGVDVTFGVSKYVGVGVIARYSRATLTFPSESDEDVEVRAGGLQFGGGLRFRF